MPIFPRSCLVLLFLLAGVFNSSFGQDTVPSEPQSGTTSCTVKYAAGYQNTQWSSGNLGMITTGEICAQKFHESGTNQNSSYSYSLSIGDHEHCDVSSSYNDYVCFTHVRTSGAGSTSYFYYFAYPTGSGTVQVCPSSHPINNGDGTCSKDPAHDQFCQEEYDNIYSMLRENDTTPAAMPRNICYEPKDRSNPSSYSCVYKELEVSIDGSPRIWRPTGEICNGADYSPVGDDGVNIDPQEPNEPSTPIDGGDLGGTDPGTEPPDTGDPNTDGLADKIDHSIRSQTKTLLDGTAVASNKTNENRDKNAKYIVEAIGRSAQSNEIHFKALIDAVKSQNGGVVDNGLLNQIYNEVAAIGDILNGEGEPCTTFESCIGDTSSMFPSLSDMGQGEFGEDGAPSLESLTTNEVELSISPDEYSFGIPSSCPPDIEITLFVGSVAIPTKPICDIADIIRLFVLAAAYIVATNKVIHAIVER